MLQRVTTLQICSFAFGGFWSSSNGSSVSLMLCEFGRYLFLHSNSLPFRVINMNFKRRCFTLSSFSQQVIWTDLPCRNFHLLICIAILEQERCVILENQFGFTEILKVSFLFNSSEICIPRLKILYQK